MIIIRPISLSLMLICGTISLAHANTVSIPTRSMQAALEAPDELSTPLRLHPKHQHQST